MIRIKTKPEIEIMQRGGKILSEVLTIIFEKLKPGVSLSELDKLAEFYAKLEIQTYHFHPLNTLWHHFKELIPIHKKCHEIWQRIELSVCHKFKETIQKIKIENNIFLINF